MTSEEYVERLERIYQIAEDRSINMMKKLIDNFDNKERVELIFDKHIRDRTIKRNTKKFYYHLVCELFTELMVFYYISEDKDQWLRHSKIGRKNEVSSK